MDVAVHIPLAKIACTSYSQARSSGDNAKAMLVNLLEEEWGTISSEIPAIMELELPSNSIVLWEPQTGKGFLCI